MVIKKKVNSNRLKVYTCSKDIEGSKAKLEGECEEFDQKVLLKQLDSPNLLRLWRTVASEFLYNTEEDEYFDVSTYLVLTNLYNAVLLLLGRIFEFAK